MPSEWEIDNCMLMLFSLDPLSYRILILSFSHSHNCLFLLPSFLGIFFRRNWQLHVNAFSPPTPSLSHACVSTHSLWCVLHSLLSWKNYAANQMLILYQTQDLKKGDLLGKGADAVVSIFLLPGNHKVIIFIRITKNTLKWDHFQELKTKIVKGSANPVFNESFQFGVKFSKHSILLILFPFSWGCKMSPTGR